MMDYKTLPKALAFCLAGVFLGYHIAEDRMKENATSIIVEPSFRNKEFARQLIEELTEKDVRHVESSDTGIYSRVNEKSINVDVNASLYERRKKIIKSVLSSNKNLSEVQIENISEYYMKEIYEF